MLFKPAWRSKNEKRALRAVERLTDEKTLASAVREAVHVSVQAAAVKKLTSPEVIAEVAKRGKCFEICEAALKRTTDQELVADIAENALQTDIRILAASKLDDQSLALSILRNFAITDTVPPYAWLASTEKMVMDEPLEEAALNIIIRLCGNTLKGTGDEKSRRSAAKTMLFLYRKYNRKDIGLGHGWGHVVLLYWESYRHKDNLNLSFENCRVYNGDYICDHNDTSPYSFAIPFDIEQT